MGMKHLNITEEIFWKMTPRKLHALIAVHAEMVSGEKAKKEENIEYGYIDTIEDW